MTNETRTAELMSLTAKALRPIAAELGITGASRMAKADLVSAIVQREQDQAPISLREMYEGTPARFNPEVIDAVHAEALKMNADVDNMAGCHVTDGCTRVAQHHGACRPTIDKNDTRWSMSFPLAKGGDGNVMQGHADYCAAWGHATNVTDGVVSSWCPRCGDTLASEQIEAKREELKAREQANVPALLCSHGIDSRRRCSICAEDTAEGVPPVLKTEAEWETAQADDLGPIEETDGRCPYGSIHEIETCFGCGTEDANGNQVSAPPLFVRHTRRGSETVVVERVHAGRVDYRILDTKTQRVSAPYRMRERTFFSNYSPAPVTA